jgi:hypothetical protein
VPLTKRVSLWLPSSSCFWPSSLSSSSSWSSSSCLLSSVRPTLSSWLKKPTFPR